jgi:hypothetical protein
MGQMCSGHVQMAIRLNPIQAKKLYCLQLAVATTIIIIQCDV